MEAENYLGSGFALRQAIARRSDGWLPMEEVARVTQPSRLKGILVSPEYGVPYLAATQVYDFRPVPRKWLSLMRTESAQTRFVSVGDIMVTRSGAVGRATLARKPHLKTIISDDLLRVDAREQSWHGWIYAYLRTHQARAMMTAERYGHIIKHLEVKHLEGLPIPDIDSNTRRKFNEKAQRILELRDRAYDLTLEAEARFTAALGDVKRLDFGEHGFSVSSIEGLNQGRRRLDAWPNTPAVRAIRKHLEKRGAEMIGLKDAGFHVWLPTRFQRVPARDGVELLDSSDLFEVNPDISKKIADLDFGDPFNGRVEAGWVLLSRSGQVYGLNGSVVISTNAYHGKVVSDHIIRIRPTERRQVPVGYLFTALSHPRLGRPVVKSLAYGSSVPEIDPSDVEQLRIVRIDEREEKAISILAETAAALAADADLLEREIASDGEAIVLELTKRQPAK
jgi:hypothetical protein